MTSFILDSSVDFYLQSIGLEEAKISKAFQLEKWVGITTSAHDFQRDIQDIWRPFLDKNIRDKRIIAFKVEFLKLDNELLLITIKTTQLNYVIFLKEQLENISVVLNAKHLNVSIAAPGLGWYHSFSSDALLLNDFYVSDIFYHLRKDARSCYESLVQKSSTFYVDFLCNLLNCEEEIEECAVKSVLAQQLILAFIFLKDKGEVLKFYGEYYEYLMNFLEAADKEVLEELISFMHINYQSNKEQFDAYIEVVNENVASGDAFEEQWMNEWMNECLMVSYDWQALEKEGTVFLYDTEGKPDKFLFLRAVFHIMHGQYHINFESQLNLFYIIKNCLTTKLND